MNDRRRPRPLVAIAWAIVVAACGGEDADEPDAGTGPDAAGLADADPGVDAAPSFSYPFPLPAGFPEPRLPGPLTAELAELGRHLFYDVRLSGNQTQSCASCHRQELAFTDGLAQAVGSTGEVNRRHSPSLANVAYNPNQTWANPLLVTLEQQAVVPLFGELPVELGAAGREDEILARLAAEPAYPPLFAAAFPDDEAPFTVANVVRALAGFERRLISGNSPADQAARGELELSPAAVRGRELFFSEVLECHHCHGGFNSTHAVDFVGLAEPGVMYFNTGLYNVGGAGAYPEVDQGLYEFTGLASDRGRYKPPTLRNIASPRRTCMTARWPPSRRSSPSTSAAAGSSRTAPTPATAGPTPTRASSWPGSP
ncbi:MAG: cytochrome c peroxidase [Kofleriaceae bacterium]